MSTTEEQSESESGRDKHQEGASNGGTSRRRIEANRENSQKATGPKSVDGKARSSKNSTKHGIFVSRLEALKSGPFAEDPSELREKVDAIMASLAPRDPLEFAMATRIAALCNSFDRLERWSTALFDGASRRTSLDYEAGVGSEYRRGLMVKSMNALVTYLEGLISDDEADFLVFAHLVKRFGPDSRVGVKGLWDETHEPKDAEQWKTAYQSLVAHHWSDPSEVLSWASEVSQRLRRLAEEVDGLEEQIVAGRIMNGPFDLQLKYHARIRRELTKLLEEYGQLQKRDLPGKNEPNGTGS